MLFVGTIVIMLAVGYAQYRNGLSSSVFMLIAVLLAGFVAFNLFEPLADSMEPSLQAGTIAGCEDLIALVLIFGAVLLALRVAVFNYLARDMIEQHGKLQYLGAGVVGIVTGYSVAGFLTCALQTLPLDVHFLDFEPRSETQSPWRQLVPPDRVWLSMMRTAGAHALYWQKHHNGEDEAGRPTFDRHGTFELRYLRYRRNTDARGPMPYLGEFDRELYGKEKKR